MKVQTTTTTKAPGLTLGPERLWPHPLLDDDAGRSRVAALLAAVELAPDWTRPDLGLGPDVEWRTNAPHGWAVVHRERVAYEVPDDHDDDDEDRRRRAVATLVSDVCDSELFPDDEDRFGVLVDAITRAAVSSGYDGSELRAFILGCCRFAR